MLLKPLQVQSLANETANYTFTQTVDLSNSGQTYSIEAKTDLAEMNLQVTIHLQKKLPIYLSNDVGAIEITAPVTGSWLG